MNKKRQDLTTDSTHKSLRMSKKCLLLRDIKNYLKKLECGQLEIEAGQWELHKDILNLKKMFDELKNFKEDFEEMKKSGLEQMGIIQKLESAVFPKSDGVCPKKSNSCVGTDEVYNDIDKRKTKNCSKDPKKSHIVQSEEIIEITSHVESSSTKSGSDSKSEEAEDRRRKKDRRTKKHSSSPLCSFVYCPKLASGSGMLNSKIRFPPKKKDNAILQRYLNDSAKYCDEKASSPVANVFKSAETCERSFKKDEQWKSDSWNSFNNTSRCFNSRESDTSAERKFVPHNAESLIPKTMSHNKEKKVLMMSSHFTDKSKRKKKESTYVCGVCKKGFHTKDLLKAHEVIHRKMSENFMSYKCDYCSNECKTPEILEKHSRKCQLIRSLFRKS